MVTLKSPKEIELMKEGGAILKSVADILVSMIEPGISTKEIDAEAEKLLVQRGAKPSFKTVEDYSWSTCLPVNFQAVHTPPSALKLKNGDILTIDIGALYGGLHTDYAVTVAVGQIEPEVESFLAIGEKTLDEAISMVKEEMHLGEIGSFIYNQITDAGYSIMKDLSGHGIGKELHEDPFVLNYLKGPVNKTFKVKKGLTIAMEIIYSMGAGEMAYESGVPWSIITKDKSLCACFEKSIAIADKNTFILT